MTILNYKVAVKLLAIVGVCWLLWTALSMFVSREQTGTGPYSEARLGTNDSCFIQQGCREQWFLVTAFDSDGNTRLFKVSNKVVMEFGVQNEVDFTKLIEEENEIRADFEKTKSQFSKEEQKKIKEIPVPIFRYRESINSRFAFYVNALTRIGGGEIPTITKIQSHK